MDFLLEEIEELKKQKEKILKEKNSLLNVDIKGIEVSHKKFGKGKIKELTNGIDNDKIKIEFENGIIKDFAIPISFLNEFVYSENNKINEVISNLSNLYEQISYIKENIEVLTKQIKNEEESHKLHDIKNYMIAVLTDESYEDDIELNLYYDKARNGSRKYGYIGFPNTLFPIV